MFDKMLGWMSGSIFNNVLGPVVRRIVAVVVASVGSLSIIDLEVLERWAADSTTILMALAVFVSSLALSWIDKSKKA